MERLMIIALAVSVTLGSSLSALTEEHSIVVKGISVQRNAPANNDEGPSYILTYDLPQTSRRVVESAFLEFYIDVASMPRGSWVYLDPDSIERVGYRNIAPMIEVYALTSQFSGTLEPSQLVKRTALIRPVAIGNNQRVVLDITPIFREHLKDPGSNHGLIIGSLSGWKEGNFELKLGSFENGDEARIRAYLSPRYE